jgi:hypothetical protein
MIISCLPCLRAQLNVVLQHEGSTVGKMNIKDRQHMQCVVLLEANYFADNPIYTPKDYQRHFRMNKLENCSVVFEDVEDYDMWV